MASTEPRTPFAQRMDALLDALSAAETPEDKQLVMQQMHEVMVGMLRPRRERETRSWYEREDD